MAAPRWGVFVGFVAVVTAAVVGFARLSAGAIDEEASRLPPRTLLVNVALSQGLFGSLLVFGAWYAEIPPAVLGVGPDAVAPDVLATGLVVGVALYAGNEVAATALRRVGVDVPERLRALLAPRTLGGWAVLLGGVLPVIAGFEELLFRAALVGGLTAATPVPPVVLVAASSLLFGLAHSAQGTAGMVVATLLGVALAALFVITGSLIAVVLAHYVVNALEFVVHEGLGVEPGRVD